MDSLMIDGVCVTPLKRIVDDRGEIRHAMRSSDQSFDSFGEAYFSGVKHGVVKGWKKHQRMHSNLIVVQGAVRFVLFDPRPTSETYLATMDVTHSLDNYSRLTIPPGLWMAFQGASKETNLLLNIASISHDPAESQNMQVDSAEAIAACIPEFDWNVVT